jgi:hypothetical protein
MSTTSKFVILLVCSRLVTNSEVLWSEFLATDPDFTSSKYYNIKLFRRWNKLCGIRWRFG